MQHRPEVAIALAQSLWIVTKMPRPNASGEISGCAIAVGWDRPQESTFYLVSDPEVSYPIWVPEDEIVSNSVRP